MASSSCTESDGQGLGQDQMTKDLQKLQNVVRRPSSSSLTPLPRHCPHVPGPVDFALATCSAMMDGCCCLRRRSWRLPTPTRKSHLHTLQPALIIEPDPQLIMCTRLFVLAGRVTPGPQGRAGPLDGRPQAATSDGGGPACQCRGPRACQCQCAGPRLDVRALGRSAAALAFESDSA